jgi:hypothetical protein
MAGQKGPPRFRESVGGPAPVGGTVPSYDAVSAAYIGLRPELGTRLPYACPSSPSRRDDGTTDATARFALRCVALRCVALRCVGVACMTEYRRGLISARKNDLWHWQPGCQSYPVTAYATRNDKPSDDDPCSICATLRLVLGDYVHDLAVVTLAGPMRRDGERDEKPAAAPRGDRLPTSSIS